MRLRAYEGGTRQTRDRQQTDSWTDRLMCTGASGDEIDTDASGQMAARQAVSYVGGGRGRGRGRWQQRQHHQSQSQSEPASMHCKCSCEHGMHGRPIRKLFRRRDLTRRHTIARGRPGTKPEPAHQQRRRGGYPRIHGSHLTRKSTRVYSIPTKLQGTRTKAPPSKPAHAHAAQSQSHGQRG